MSVTPDAEAKVIVVVGHGLAGRMTVDALSKAVKKQSIRVIVVESREAPSPHRVLYRTQHYSNHDPILGEPFRN